ncbi:hypothetical protein [Terrisporobacter sp.]
MKKIKRIITLLVVALIFAGVYINKPQASYASDSSNATKMLSTYKKHNYSTAEKYAKKLKGTKSDPSESKMSASMTKAYVNILLNTPEKYLWNGIYFVDMDGDDKSEMILPYGTCEADAVAYVYKYKSGKAVKVAKLDYGHTLIANYPGHKGIICMRAHMGYEEVYTVYLKNGKLSYTKYGNRNVPGDYLSLKPLNNHLISSGKWNL